MHGLVTKKSILLHTKNPIAVFLAIFSIYALMVPLVIMDISVALYQVFYFGVFDIPKVRRKDYVVMDRWDLRRLNPFQKLNCVYCEYANGVTAWAKAVAGQTEIYSCAIKHKHMVRGQLEGDAYYKYSDFKRPVPEN